MNSSQRNALGGLILMFALSACATAPTNRVAANTNVQSANSAEVQKTTVAQVETAQNEETAEEDPIVCKKERAVQSRIAKRRCAPQSEWDRISEQAENDFRDIKKEFNRAPPPDFTF